MVRLKNRVSKRRRSWENNFCTFHLKLWKGRYYNEHILVYLLGNRYMFYFLKKKVESQLGSLGNPTFARSVLSYGKQVFNEHILIYLLDNRYMVSLNIWTFVVFQSRVCICNGLSDFQWSYCRIQERFLE